MIFKLRHSFQFRTKYGSPLQSWWSPKPEGFLSYPCFFSDRDLHFILHLNDRKSRWNVRAQTMVSAVGGLALAARAAWQARRNIWGRLGFVPTNFWRKKSSHNYYFLEKNLSNEERFYMTMLEITGPNQFYNYSVGPVSVHRHAA